MHSMHFYKMKSSETYINRQAPPKVAFVPNWSDFSFRLSVHATCDTCSEGSTTATYGPQDRGFASTAWTFNSQSSHLHLSDMAGQALELL